MKNLLLIFLLLPLFSKAQNLILDGDIKYASPHWTTSCVRVENYLTENIYGGTSTQNYVDEIDDETCMHQDVCILPGATYKFTVDASRRTAGGPNPCITHLTITGLNQYGAAISTFIDMDFTRTNTVFALTSVMDIPLIKVPARSGVTKLRVDFRDNTPGFSTGGMIIDNISLVVVTLPAFIDGLDTTCLSIPYSTIVREIHKKHPKSAKSTHGVFENLFAGDQKRAGKDKSLVKEYKILHATSIDNIEQQVNNAIGQEWQPYGSLIIETCSDEERIYYQVMVK